MSTELSETYIFVRSEVRGKKRLIPEIVNPLLQRYRKLLEDFRIEEKSDDGRIFKVWTQVVGEFSSELSADSKTLLFSHQLKLNIYNNLMRGSDNQAHHIQVKLATALGKIRIEEGIYSQKIIIETTGIKFTGGERTPGRWPQERLAGARI